MGESEEMWEKMRRCGREGGDVGEGRDLGGRKETWERGRSHGREGGVVGEREVWEEGGDVGVSVEGRSCGRGEMLKRTRRHGSEGDVGRREEV